MSEIIDLSVSINERTPVYPGDPVLSIKPAGVLADDGFEDHLLCIGTHVGTHIDAPRHMLAGGKSLNEIPLEQFIGCSVYVKIKDTFNLEMVQNADIKAGDIVLFDTGWTNKYHDKSYFEDYPAMSDEVAEYLIEKRIKMIGLDMCSPDHEPFPIHKKLLGAGVLIAKNLTNLDQLHGKQFRVIALPLNVEIDGAPARVIAEI